MISRFRLKFPLLVTVILTFYLVRIRGSSIKWRSSEVSEALAAAAAVDEDEDESDSFNQMKMISSGQISRRSDDEEEEDSWGSPSASTSDGGSWGGGGGGGGGKSKGKKSK